MKKLLAFLFAAAILLSGCNKHAISITDTTAPTDSVATTGSSDTVQSDMTDLFSNRDYETGYDSTPIGISLNGSGAACDSNAVQISGSTVTITKAGTYVLQGTLDDGMVIVNIPKDEKVQLVLNGANITSLTSAPLYILQADKVFLTLAEGSANALSNGGTFTAIDDNNIDAVIFSKEDLTMNGMGSLSIASPAGHGIVSKDELTVTGGSYTITSASHGLSGKDNICIDGVDMTIASGKDGIHAESDEAGLGFVYIEDGTFHINAEGDGISASASMQLQNGTYEITTGGGSANAQKQTSDNWGGFGGGMGGGPGGMGGRPGGRTATADTSTEDSTSIKAIKAAGSLVINGGSYTIDAADDALHSNDTVSVCGGNFQIATGDDGFHADEKLTIAGGTIQISESYEGLEGKCIEVTGGDCRLICSDDGLNAAGGTDQSGFGGFRGGDHFGGSATSDSYINISGGTVSIQASGDGIDSNGTLHISGGYITVCGPTSGDTAVLDYETSGSITGGTFIGTGAYMMAQTFSSSQQGVIALSVGNISASTRITLCDANGNLLIEHTPALPYAIVILSTPDMVKGQTYTVTIGSQSGTFEAN